MITVGSYSCDDGISGYQTWSQIEDSLQRTIEPSMVKNCGPRCWWAIGMWRSNAKIRPKQSSAASREVLENATDKPDTKATPYTTHINSKFE